MFGEYNPRFVYSECKAKDGVMCLECGKPLTNHAEGYPILCKKCRLLYKESAKEAAENPAFKRMRCHTFNRRTAS